MLLPFLCFSAVKLQTEMKPISDASVTVFIEEEKSQNASKLDRMAPDEEIFYRLAIDKKMLPSIPNDTNTKRHLSVMQEYVKFIFNQDDAELKKHFGSVLRNVYIRQTLIGQEIRRLIGQQSLESRL